MSGDQGQWTRLHPQCALDPAGHGAAQTAELFWIMMIAPAVIWFLVIGIAVYAVRVRPGAYGIRGGQTMIIGGGIIFPVVVLAALLTKRLAMMPGLRPAESGLHGDVVGEQWWWRVRYWPPGAAIPIESANEVRLPLGERTEFTLVAKDVIHSF